MGTGQDCCAALKWVRHVARVPIKARQKMALGLGGSMLPIMAVAMDELLLWPTSPRPTGSAKLNTVDCW